MSEAAVGHLMDDLSDAYDELESGAEPSGEELRDPPVSQDPEPTPSPEDQPEQEEPEGKQEEPEKPEEDPLQPHEHWRNEYKEVFKTLPRPAQEAWLTREREFSQRYEEKSRELNQVKNFARGVAGTIQPLVPAWQRKGMTPDQGLRSLMAREQALHQDPKETLLRMADEYGVNLEQAFQDSPYVDPQVKAVQDELRQLKQEREQWQMQQRQRSQQMQAEKRQNAELALRRFTSEVDESGSLKYPHATNDLFAGQMAKYISSNPGATLEQAYQQVEAGLKSHPWFKSQLEQATQQTSAEQRAKVERAKRAAKSVDSSDTTGSQVERSLRDDIAMALDEQGID